MSALGDAPDGLSPADLSDRVRVIVPETLQGGGLRWWVTAARLALEAEGRVTKRPKGRTVLFSATAST
jgi:hypothetical protein